jgi:hypothetical protein
MKEREKSKREKAKKEQGGRELCSAVSSFFCTNRHVYTHAPHRSRH